MQGSGVLQSEPQTISSGLGVDVCFFIGLNVKYHYLALMNNEKKYIRTVKNARILRCNFLNHDKCRSTVRRWKKNMYFHLIYLYQPVDLQGSRNGWMTSAPQLRLAMQMLLLDFLTLLEQWEQGQGQQIQLSEGKNLSYLVSLSTVANHFSSTINMLQHEL